MHAEVVPVGPRGLSVRGEPLQRLLDRASRAWDRGRDAWAGWSRRRAEANLHRLQLQSLVHLSDATLRDIGAPEDVRAYAAELREMHAVVRASLVRAGYDSLRW